MAKTIVILHGWGSSAKSFTELTKFLKEKNYEIYILGLPGFGEIPPPEVAWSVGDYSNFVLRFIQSQNLDKFYLFGHSFGGRIALKFAALHPEKLAGLILCDSAGVTSRPRFKLGVSLILSKIGSAIFSVQILKPLRGLARRVLYFVMRRGDYYHLENEAMRETFKKVVNENLTPYLAQIKLPTLIIWGKKDKMTPLSDAYIINKNIPGSRLEIFENAGHSPHLEMPQKLAEYIDKFIKSTNN